MQRTFAAFVFLGALLLFALEPMAGRIVLPLFGSAFHVWSTTLLFFQCTLVLAYAYAHLVAPRIGAWHLALLGLTFLALPWTLLAVSAAPTPCRQPRRPAEHSHRGVSARSSPARPAGPSRLQAVLD